MRIVSINVHYQDKLGYQDYFLGKSWKEMGHEVHFISSDIHFDYPDYERTVRHIIGDRYVGTGIFYNDYGVPVHRLKGTTRKFTGMIWLKGLKRKLDELNPDIIVCHGVFSWQAIRLTFLRVRFKSVIIMDDHTTINLVRKGRSASVAYFLFRILFAKRIIKTSHKLIGISDTCIGVMQKYFGLSCPKLVMIPLGSDTSLFYKDQSLRTTYRNKLNIQEEEILVVYTGKIYAIKNAHLIIDALNDINIENQIRINVLFIGDIASDYYDFFKKKTDSSKLRTIVNPAIPVEQLVSVYNAADIAVWPDHLTNSTIDASACGCPIICSNYMTERVKFNNGMTIKAGDLNELISALRLLITNPGLRKKMGENGIRYVEQEMSWKAIAKRFISL